MTAFFSFSSKILNFMNVTKQLINCSLHKFALNFKSKLCMNDFRKTTQYEIKTGKEGVIKYFVSPAKCYSS